MRYTIVFLALSAMLTTSLGAQTSNSLGGARALLQDINTTDAFSQISGTPTGIAPISPTRIQEAAADGSAVAAGDAAGCGTACGGCDCCNGFKLRGWVDVGLVWNTDDPTSNFNGPFNSVDRTEPMMNQLYFIAEKGLPACGTGFGGRVDLLYGTDFNVAESNGLERHQDGTSHWNPQYYGLAFPQAYFSVGSKRASLVFGHFYSEVNYESVMAVDNFFYTHSYSYQFADPLTSWGLLAKLKPNDCLSVNLGMVNGSNTFDGVSDNVGFLGKVRWDSPSSGFWTSFAVQSGKDFNNSVNRAGVVNDFTNRTRTGWIFGVPLNCCTEYVFHNFVGRQEDALAAGGSAYWYGVDQYLYRTINPCLKAGARFEWFRDEDGTRVGLNRPSNPNAAPFFGNFYSLALGLNWKPSHRTMLRPEVRYDWYSGRSTLPFDDGLRSSQLLFGLDAIFTF